MNIQAGDVLEVVMDGDVYHQFIVHETRMNVTRGETPVTEFRGADSQWFVESDFKSVKVIGRKFEEPEPQARLGPDSYKLEIGSDPLPSEYWTALSKSIDCLSEKISKAPYAAEHLKDMQSRLVACFESPHNPNMELPAE